MKQHAQQGVAVALAAGKHADALEHIALGEQERPQQAAQLGLRGARRQLLQIVEHALFRIELLVLVLREIIRLDVVSQATLSASHRIQPGQKTDQRGFPCSVHAHQRDAVAAFAEAVDILTKIYSKYA